MINQQAEAAMPAPTIETALPPSPEPAGQPTPSRITRIAHDIARRTDPLAVRLAGGRVIPLWVVVRHVGRRSGRVYATPVAARRTPDGFVIPVPFGVRTQWARNVIAAGNAVIRSSGVEYRVTEPLFLDLDTGRAAFGRVQRLLLRVAGIREFLAVRLAEPGRQSR